MFKYIVMVLLINNNLFAQKIYSLEECIELAVNNNFKVKQSELQVESVLNQYNQTKNNQLPTVNGVLNQGYNVGRTIDPYSNDIVTNQMSTNNLGLRANWLIYNGFQNKKLLEQTLLQLKGNNYDVEIVKNEIKLNVIFAYMEVLTAIELKEVSNSQVLLTKLQVENIEKLVRLKVIPESNLYDIKATLAGDEFQLINAANNYRTVKLRLKRLINSDFGLDFDIQPLKLENNSVDKKQNLVFEQALNNYPVIHANLTKIEFQNKNLEIIKASKLPTITMYGAWGTSYSSLAKKQIISNDIFEAPTNQFISLGDKKVPVMQFQPDVSTEKINLKNQFVNNNNLSFGLSLNVPIFNVTMSKNKIQQVKIQKKLLENENKNVKTQLYQDIEEAFIQKDNAFEKYESLKQQLFASEKAFSVAEIKLNAGILNSIDYSITKANLDKAKANLVQAKYEYYFRIKIIEFYHNL